ncbi:hypothetical protein MRS44_009514 [Fusarium solani]|uniref:uncharacterized protein n=1 Tax=Fusarium solani TaxID=169388 RepID=UPI0032C4687E|nr:hypothetical protein MRS44_009514 [Fusarium solani]
MRPIPRPAWMTNYLVTIPAVISSIRQHPPGVDPTLDSIPQLNWAMLKDEPLSCIIQHMQEDGFRNWGFVVYRCAYANDSQWESYLEFLKEAVREDLEFFELETLLWKHLKWTIIEDPEDLDSASKQHVQERFSDWAAARSVERDGPGADDPWLRKRPRFKYCIYVDQRCLDTVDQYQAWVEQGAIGIPKTVVCAILDRTSKPSGRGRDGYPSVEGCTKMDTGWMYTDVSVLSGVYDRLSVEELSKRDYERPPEVWPMGDPMPFEP